MFEYHGWVSLRATVAVEDSPEADAHNEARLYAAVEALRRRVAEIGDWYLVDVRWMNGSPFLHLAGNPNHRGMLGDEILELFRYVARIAPGSYGLLYLWDDEDARYDNEFRVFRVVRGTVTEHADPFLSPAVPVLEDEDTGGD
jgi:hypothetical protein